MDFFIKHKSTEPILKMRLVENGRYDFSDLYDRLMNAHITFSMKKDNLYKVYRQDCGIIAGEPTSEINAPVYYIYYKWNPEDVDEKGTFEGEFHIKFYDGGGVQESTLIAPIREKLLITVL